MPDRNLDQIKRNVFLGAQDRYQFEPFEGAMFHWDHSAKRVCMKFVGWSYDTPIAIDHRIFNDAILNGREITKSEYEAGRVEEQ